MWDRRGIKDIANTEPARPSRFHDHRVAKANPRSELAERSGNGRHGLVEGCAVSVHWGIVHHEERHATPGASAEVRSRPSSGGGRRAARSPIGTQGRLDEPGGR